MRYIPVPLMPSNPICTGHQGLCLPPNGRRTHLPLLFRRSAPHRRDPLMAFLRSLDTKAMGEYATRHFAWDRRGGLCLSFELAVAEGAVEYYELPDLPQLIFYAMLLSEAERLGDEHFGLWSRPSLSSVGAPSSRESGCMLTGSSRLDSTERSDQGRVQGLVRKKRASKWSRRMRARPWRRRPPLRMRWIGTPIFPYYYGVPSCPQHEGDGQLYEGVLHLALEEHFHAFCPCFLLSEAEGAAADFELPEIVQATFYAMLLNEAVELGVVYDFTVESMKPSLIGLRWLTFKVWMGCVDHVLRAAQLQRPADEVDVHGSLNGREEGSRSNGSSAPSSVKE
ncbi:hypothetical protein Cgig2_015270 [Carnegiea gigantea]|uniref:Uncharacterized protein n=1 Tax=Carnegiea gigantea TaxID=171969 RepID=A0A9Q1GH52_9CARY|nr:hypothetical protein Cgig2_015270 [Carnegiea gigantea]